MTHILDKIVHRRAEGNGQHQKDRRSGAAKTHNLPNSQSCEIPSRMFDQGRDALMLAHAREVYADAARNALLCTQLYVLDGEKDALVRHSARFLESLIALWEARAIDVSAIWREIDHRAQLGNLLLKLNSDWPSSRHGVRKRWRPSSTKLP